MKTLFAFLVLFAPVAVLADSDQAQNIVDRQTSVKLLGTFLVGPTLKTYRLPVHNCAKEIKSIKLRASRAAIYVKEVGIYFTDGNRRDFKMDKTYDAGSESKWYSIGLFRALDRRCVTEIFADGQSVDGVAKVEIFGEVKNAQ